MTQRVLSVTDYLRAVHRDGLKKIQGSFGSVASGAACAMGQAAINLGLKPGNLEVAAGKIKNEKGENLSARTFQLNDSSNHSVRDIAHLLESEFWGQMDDILVVEV